MALSIPGAQRQARATGSALPPAATANLIAAGHVGDRLVQGWLVFAAVIVFAMIIVGGATRLTDSGLSITEWQPILGIIPPLSAADWDIALQKYRSTLQYKAVNKGMTMDAFQVIFWWEWAHRMLGRFLGLVLALPLLVMWLSGRLGSGLALKVFGVGLLVGVQGGIGWYMVQSGLVNRIDVSQYRLALHLSMAFVILACLVKLVLSLSPPRAEPRLSTLTAGHAWWAVIVAALVFSQVAIGGFVAGLKAGRAYNTWPTMDGQWIPDGLFLMSPWWVNLGENITMVQFNHRMTAYILVAMAIWHAWRMVRTADEEWVSRTAVMLALGLVAQMVLGIYTVLYAVPIGLGIAHQGFAAIVFAVAIWHVHEVTRARASA